MLDPSLVDAVVRLLAVGGPSQLSQRAIARITGLSRGAVNAIATGKRLVHAPTVEAPQFSPLASRCPRCGAMVYLPRNRVVCHACHVAADRQVGQRTEGPPVELATDIRDPATLARYEKIRRRKRREAALRQEPRG